MVASENCTHRLSRQSLDQVRRHLELAVSQASKALAFVWSAQHEPSHLRAMQERAAEAFQHTRGALETLDRAVFDEQHHVRRQMAREQRMALALSAHRCEVAPHGIDPARLEEAADEAAAEAARQKVLARVRKSRKPRAPRKLG